MNERSIFMEALTKDNQADRSAYLEGACGGDAALRQRVEALLQSHEQAGSFLGKPVPDRLAEPPAKPEAEALTGELSGGGHASAAPAVSERPGIVIGPYKLLEQIGEGGMGTVFLAEQTEPVRRKVALKIIKPGMDSAQVIARFEAERQALALMDHPNIAKVLDAGTTDSGRPYFVMELVKGVPITEFCDRNRLTPRARLDLFVPVCQAIQHAHQKGIIHRDIKPSNVLVTLYDGKPVPKVIDFGIAKATDQRLTERTLFTSHGQIVGTFEYMSPEQASLDALDVDTRSDVYSLGVLLYELLTGTTPLDKERLRQAALGEVLRLIREEESPRPSNRLSASGGLPMIAAYRGTESQKLSALVRGDLDWLVMKALEKDRNRRYVTASAFAADIERYLNDELVEARPPSAGYRLRKFVKRNRGPVLAASLVVLAVLAGMVGTTWGWVEALSQRDDAVQARNDEEKQRQLALTNAADAKRNEQKAIEEGGKAKEAGEKARLLAEKEKESREQSDKDKAAAILAQKQAETNETKAEWRLYASYIAAAQREWETHNIPLLSHYLNQCRPDFRGWEHDYLYTLANQDQQTLRGHTTGVTCVAFSPDGKRLASASGMRGPRQLMESGEVKVWDAGSGREFLELQTEVAGPRSPLMVRNPAVHSVAFSPDGNHLAVASRQLGIGIWNAVTGEMVLTLNPADGRDRSSFGGETSGTGVAFSPDGKRLASIVTVDRTVKLWDLTSRKEPITLLGQKYSCVAFSPDGKRLATSGDTTVKVWDADSGKELKTLTGHEGAVHCVAFSRDSKYLASGSADHTVKLWDPDTGKEVKALKGHTSPVRALAFSPDSKYLASGSEGTRLWGDSDVKLWDAASGQNVLTFWGHSGSVQSLAFSPDGKRLASGSADRTVKLWDVAGAQEHMTVKPLGDKIGGDRIGRVAISPDGRLLAAPYQDNGPVLSVKGKPRPIHLVKLWDAASGKELGFLKGDAGEVLSVAFSADSKRLATYFKDRRVKLWDVASGEVVTTFPAQGRLLDGMAFSPDGKHLATVLTRFGPDGNLLAGVTGGRVKLWDTGTGQEIKTLEGDTGRITALAFSADSKHIASASYEQLNTPGMPGGRYRMGGPGNSPPADQTVKVWDTTNGREVLTFIGGKADIVSLAFSPDGKLLASASWDQTVKLWDAATGKEIMTFQHIRPLLHLAFSPDGKRLASTSMDNTVKLWDVTAGQEVLTLHKGETYPIKELVFSADGKRLVGLADGERDGGRGTPLRQKLIIWDASRSMKERNQKQGNLDPK